MPSSLYHKITNQLVSWGGKPPYIVGLDSASQMLKATATSLNGKDLRPSSLPPALIAPLAAAFSQLPGPLLERFYTWSGWVGATSPKRLRAYDAETVARWMVGQYPQRQYPAAMIGSPNGAAVHFCTALGIPYFPQTLLTQVRRHVSPDNARRDLEMTRAPAQDLLHHNPDLWLYQMHDPNQDRLMLRRTAYFRAKRLRLGKTLEQFLQAHLEPDATLFLIECHFSWQATRISDRHTFQFGGKGGVTIEEYFESSDRIARYLESRGSDRRKWDPPEPDGAYPESEWGFEPALREDVERFAQKHGYRVRRIIFQDPQDFSPLVADLYRWWYKQRGIAGSEQTAAPSDRLFVESFVNLQPWWTLRLGLVPFWAAFNDRVSVDKLQSYLHTADPYDEIYVNLYSNSIDSVGLASAEEWRSVIDQARQHGDFVGVNEKRYPRDLASSLRHYTELKKLPGRLPIPAPMSLSQLDDFLAQAQDQYPVDWVEPAVLGASDIPS